MYAECDVLLTTEYLYVGNFTADSSEWTTHTGSTPYLNNSQANNIGTYTTDQIDRNFDFDNTIVTDFSYITSITLDVETKTTSELVAVHAALSLDGTNFTEKGNYGFWGDSAFHFDPVTVTSFFASLANINSCTMRLTSHRSGASASVIVYRARLAVNYTVPSAGNPNSVQIMAHRREPKLEPRRMPRCQPRNLNVPLFTRRF